MRAICTDGDKQVMVGNGDAASVPECVPARMVNEYSYCPRLAYIEWVQGDFADSFDTADGRYRHRAVNDEGGDLPENVEEGETIHARSVWLSAPQEHLAARMDLLEGDGKAVTPVDYKRGPVPEVPERSWEPDRVQLCAQGLALRANGYTCNHGYIYYSSSKTRVLVSFDEALVERTRWLVGQLRQAAASGTIPPPLADSPKCVRCSLAGICLPDETNLLASSEENGSPEEEQVRRLVPARDDALPLYVQQQGAQITKNGERLEVWLRKEKQCEARLFETSQVCVFGNIQVTTQALGAMLTLGIPVSFYSTGGWFRGIAYGMSHKNVELRRTQYQAAFDPTRSLSFASSFVAAKIDNCRTLLMRNNPGLSPEVAKNLSVLSGEAREARGTEMLLGIEGNAARLYFSAFGGMLKSRQEAPDWTFDFNGRNRRPPLDPVNALLSFAYSLLVKDITFAALAVGFDPFLGFYHRSRYGRPALALDVMEEFRPIVADSVVLWVINNGIISPGDFLRRGPAVALKPEARKKFISAYEKRLDVLITHPVFGYKISYRRVLEVQVRLLGRVLSGELPVYPAFRTR